MTLLIATIKKTVPKAQTGKKRIVGRAKNNTTLAPTRRSTCLAQRTTDPDISLQDDEDLTRAIRTDVIATMSTK